MGRPRVLRLIAPYVCMAGFTALLFGPGIATAQPKPTLAVQGQLRNLAGLPATDGAYTLTFSFYEAVDDAEPLFFDVHASVQVVDGRFSAQVGSILPLSAEGFYQGKVMWLGVRVGDEPELPRKPLEYVPYALRADRASGLVCSGCVQEAHLDAAVLLPYATWSGLSEIATTGSWTHLKNVPALVGTDQKCAVGSVISGIDADGAVLCEAIPTYDGTDFAVSGKQCAAGSTQLGTDANGQPVCSGLGLAPIGSIVAWHKSLAGTVQLPGGWVECSGQTLNDPGSPYHGKLIPNLNGEGRFLSGHPSSGGTGGSTTHSHSFSQTSTDYAPDASHFADGSLANPSSHLPPFYYVVWVIRVR